MSAGGHPRIFKTPEDMLEKWEEYKKTCELPTEIATPSKHIVKYKYLSKTGFINYLKCNNNIYNDYKKLEGYSEILDKIKTDCKQNLLEMGLNNLFNPKIVALIAGTHYGMSERAINENNNNNTNVNMSYEEYRKKLEEEEAKAKLDK